MTTKPITLPARDTGKQVVHTIRKTINFNDANIAAPTDPFACIPKGSFIVRQTVEIVAAFNAGTTNVLTVGTTTANANELVASGDVNEAATGVTQNIATGLGRGLAAAGDINLYAKFAQTGTVATAGQAVYICEYVPNNDQ